MAGLKHPFVRAKGTLEHLFDNRHTFSISVLFLFVLVLGVGGCTHKYHPEDLEQRLVTFRVAELEQIPFSQGSKLLQDHCTRISFALFQDGQKVKTINQDVADEGFGSCSIALEAGAYTLVTVAHNGLGNATINSPEKVTFYKNKTTDSFCAVDTLEVVPGSCYNIMLHRVVAMFRLLVQDNMPSDVRRMKFYYTGGSSTLNPSTGFGCVNSRQTEYFDIDETMAGLSSQFEVYTFPHQYNDTLSIKIGALDGNDSLLHERQLESVPVTTNMITQYSTVFFGSTDASVSVSIFNGGRWAGVRYWSD